MFRLVAAVFFILAASRTPAQGSLRELVADFAEPAECAAALGDLPLGLYDYLTTQSASLERPDCELPWLWAIGNLETPLASDAPAEELKRHSLTHSLRRVLEAHQEPMPFLESAATAFCKASGAAGFTVERSPGADFAFERAGTKMHVSQWLLDAAESQEFLLLRFYRDEGDASLHGGYSVLFREACGGGRITGGWVISTLDYVNSRRARLMGPPPPFALAKADESFEEPEDPFR